MESTDRYYRKVIKIRGQDSPNVRYALAQIAAGKVPTGEVIIPGVLPWNDYIKRRKLWDKIRQCVSLDADFYEGYEVLIFPPHWLERAKRIDFTLRDSKVVRRAKAIGIDPAEGGDKTSMAAVDELGLIDLVSEQTPDTTRVVEMAIEFMRKHKLKGDRVMFDRGGGGKQHADRMRKMGHKVETVAFGEPATAPLKRAQTQFPDRLENAEDRASYFNRRAELYYELSSALDPSVNPRGFGIPLKYANLFDELGPIPKMYDSEGKLKLLSKHKKNKDSDELTLTELIGHSPDEADALAIAYHHMTRNSTRSKAGSIL